MIFLTVLISILLVTPAFSQSDRRALSVADIEELLKAGVTSKRLAALIEERGIDFQVTGEVQEKLKKGGGDERIMQAVEKASLEYTRKRLEDTRSRAEEERKRQDEEKRKVEELRSGLLAETKRFFTGKTIRIIVGLSAGGGFDTYSRLIGRHLGKYIPGSPSVVIENMPGAGTLISANYVFKSARPDGLTVGNFHGAIVLQAQLFGAPGAEYDARRFEWIGAPARENIVCAMTKASGVTSMERWMRSKTPAKLGGIGGANSTDDIPKILKATLGVPIQLVTGYNGTGSIRLAAERGEIAGGCWAWESMKVTWRQAVESGNVTVVLQATPRAHGDLLHVPLAINFAGTTEARRLIEVGIHDAGAITRPYVLPPGTPRERLLALRRAFWSTMTDPVFLSEAAKSRLNINALTGEEVERTVHRLTNSDPTILARLKEILR